MATLRRGMEGFFPTVSYQLTAAPFFAAAARRGIAPPATHTTDGRVGSQAFYDVVGKLFRSNPEQSMGLLLRDSLGPASDGELRALVQCAPTIGDALAVMGDVRSLFFDDLRLDVIRDGRHAVLRLQFSETDPEGSMEFAAGVLGGALAYVTMASGRMPKNRLVTRRARLGGAHLRSVFGHVSTHTREDFLLLPRSILHVRPPSGNEALFTYFAAEARARAERRLWATSTRERVRAVLAAEPVPLRANVSSVAEALGLCTRTLQRRLEEEGTSFGRVQGAVLRQRTLDGLMTGSARNVAASLGYADASAFHRAVRSWSGLTPGALGETLRA